MRGVVTPSASEEEVDEEEGEEDGEDEEDDNEDEGEEEGDEDVEEEAVGRVRRGLEQELRAAGKKSPQRRGARIRSVKFDRYRAIMPKRSYYRFMRRRKHLDRTVKRLQEEVADLRHSLSREYHRPEKPEMISAVALLMARGVSATAVPEVVSIVSFLLLGDARVCDLVAPSTALRYSAVSGAVQKQRVLAKIMGDGTRKPAVFVGTDTTSRGGSIASFVVSTVPPGSASPVALFVSFLECDGASADALAQQILSFVSTLGSVDFAGFSSDAPAVMVGSENGVGERLCGSLKRFIRHDTCEHHASACVARVVERIWPARMNEPSVTQFVFVAWYLLNHNWTASRAIMSKQLTCRVEDMDGGILGMLEKMYPGVAGPAAGEILFESGQLNKPEKPDSNRWGTQAAMFLFVHTFLPLLNVVFDELREFGGAKEGAGVGGSVGSIAQQFLRWSGCPQLRATFDLACEYLAVWREHDMLVGLDDLDYGVKCYHKVFGRTRRALALYRAMARGVGEEEARVFLSYEALCDSYPGETDDVVGLISQLFRTGRDTVMRNHGRYFCGVYVFGALGDPHFALIAFEALSHLRKHKRKPLVRTAEGLELEKLIRDQEEDLSDLHGELFRKLTNREHLEAAFELVSILQAPSNYDASDEQRAAFVAAVRKPGKNVVALQLNSWMAVLSSTQPVEKTFLDYDHSIPKNSSGKKAKKSAPGGRAVSLASISANVQVERVLSDGKHAELFTSNARAGEKKRRVQDQRGIIRVIGKAFENNLPTKKELVTAFKAVKRDESFYRQPRGGVSKRESLLLSKMQDQYDEPDFRRARKRMDEVLEEGRGFKIPIVSVCFSDERCLRRDGSKQGSQGKFISCSSCEKRFHRKCVAEVTKDLPESVAVVELCDRCEPQIE